MCFNHDMTNLLETLSEHKASDSCSSISSWPDRRLVCLALTSANDEYVKLFGGTLISHIDNLSGQMKMQSSGIDNTQACKLSTALFDIENVYDTNQSAVCTSIDTYCLTSVMF